VPTQHQIRQSITNQIIESLESGDIPPWRRPWIGNGLPVNVVSKRRYSGVNILLLQLHLARHQLSSKYFATFRQWQALGCRVKPRPSHVPPGKWACTIVYYRLVEKTELNDAGVEEQVRYPVLRTYQVFSASQVEPQPKQCHPEVDPAQPAFADYGPAEEAIAATNADIRFQGESAYYMTPTSDGGDYICCPEKGRFRQANDYYATLLHELGHWSETRLGVGRQLCGR
jgi:antirestriction protein ArdC